MIRLTLLTPADIRNREFKQRWVSGYDMDEVETFLKQVADAFEQLAADNDMLHGQVKSMESELDEFRNKRRHLEEALISAQRIIEDMKTNAKKEAELIMKEAEVQADRWIADANAQVLEIKRDVNNLEMLRKEYEIKLRSLLESHLELLDVMCAPERRDGKQASVRTSPAPVRS